MRDQKYTGGRKACDCSECKLHEYLKPGDFNENGMRDTLEGFLNRKTKILSKWSGQNFVDKNLATAKTTTNEPDELDKIRKNWTKLFNQLLQEENRLQQQQQYDDLTPTDVPNGGSSPMSSISPLDKTNKVTIVAECSGTTNTRVDKILSNRLTNLCLSGSSSSYDISDSFDEIDRQIQVNIQPARRNSNVCDADNLDESLNIEFTNVPTDSHSKRDIAINIANQDTLEQNTVISADDETPKVRKSNRRRCVQSLSSHKKTHPNDGNSSQLIQSRLHGKKSINTSLKRKSIEKSDDNNQSMS